MNLNTAINGETGLHGQGDAVCIIPVFDDLLIGSYYNLDYI